MTKFIEINEKNLARITELNNGVAPVIEEPKTFYVHWDHDTLVNEIVTPNQVQKVTELLPSDLYSIEY